MSDQKFPEMIILRLEDDKNKVELVLVSVTVGLNAVLSLCLLKEITSTLFESKI